MEGCTLVVGVGSASPWGPDQLQAPQADAPVAARGQAVGQALGAHWQIVPAIPRGFQLKAPGPLCPRTQDALKQAEDACNDKGSKSKVSSSPREGAAGWTC